jgi:hypothetical protein
MKVRPGVLGMEAPGTSPWSHFDPESGMPPGGPCGAGHSQASPQPQLHDLEMTWRIRGEFRIELGGTPGPQDVAIQRTPRGRHRLLPRYLCVQACVQVRLWASVGSSRSPRGFPTGACVYPCQHRFHGQVDWPWKVGQARVYSSGSEPFARNGFGGPPRFGPTDLGPRLTHDFSIRRF